MPVGAILGGVASIGGALIGASGQKKAAKQASAAQQDATQSQLTLGRESMALNRDIYESNRGILSPFVGRGNVAGDQINALLGLPSTPAPAPQAPAAQPATAAPRQLTGSYNLDNGLNGFARMLMARRGGETMGGEITPGIVSRQPLNPGTTTPTSSVPAGVAANPMNALNNFANSAGMQFQQQEAGKAINHSAAGGGWLESGAALKALSDRSQDIALNNYFMPYMGLLGGQQAVGAGAASSIAGVGTNFGNTAAGINSQMGANIQNGANAASNAALLRGQANSNMWNTIGSSFGNIVGGIKF
jgi:hypothetical protein